MKKVQFLELNEMSMYCRTADKYFTFKAQEVKEVSDTAAAELVQSGKFKYVEQQDDGVPEAGDQNDAPVPEPKKRGRKKAT